MTDSIQGGLKAQVFLNRLYKYVVLSENGRVFWGVPERTVRAALANRMASGRMVSHVNEQGEIDGLLLWYRLKKGWKWDWERLTSPGADDENGDEIHIAAALADSEKVRRIGILRFIAKEPDALHLQLSALRMKGGSLQRMEYSQKLLAKLLK